MTATYVIGTVTITGDMPMEVDGLYLGHSRRVLRFTWRSDGLARKGKLYKTQDPAYLAERLGMTDYKVTSNWRIQG